MRDEWLSERLCLLDSMVRIRQEQTFSVLFYFTGYSIQPRRQCFCFYNFIFLLVFEHVFSIWIVVIGNNLIKVNYVLLLIVFYL